MAENDAYLIIFSFYSLITVANYFDVDLEEALNIVLEKYKKRLQKKVLPVLKAIEQRFTLYFQQLRLEIHCPTTDYKIDLGKLT